MKRVEHMVVTFDYFVAMHAWATPTRLAKIAIARAYEEKRVCNYKLQMGGACELKIDCTCTYSII